MRSKQHTHAERGRDLYETPPCATRALLAHETLPAHIWEPCAGRGAIVDVLRASQRRVVASDLVDYQTEAQFSGVDFLTETQVPPGCTAIVTNPPYQLAAQMVVHALTLVPRVYMLLRLAFLEAGHDRSIAGRARLEALDGGALARVLVFRNRLPMMHRDGWAGPRASSAVAYAWFVWDRAHRGDATIRRIAWSENGGARLAGRAPITSTPSSRGIQTPGVIS